MTFALPSLRRRDVMRGWLGLSIFAGLDAGRAYGRGTGSHPASNPIFPDGLTLTVAGPEGGELDAWADRLLAAFDRFLPANPQIRRIMTGGLDGITGANQFAAQAQPDGSAALLAPGTAALACLLGDPRVREDLGHGVPLLEGVCPLLLAGRIDPTTLVRGQKLRIGVSAPYGREMTAVLGLEQLGLVPVPVPGLVDLAMAQSAFAQHSVDVILLHGTPDILTLAASNDARPICSFGVPDGSGALARDPALPKIPHLGELLGGMPMDPLTTGWRASVVAAQQVFSLHLPPLTPAAMIARWRHAVEQTAALPDLMSLAATQALHLRPDPIKPPSDLVALTALRAWFADRSRG